MLGGLANSKMSGQWIHLLAAAAAQPFLTTSSQAQENNEKDSDIRHEDDGMGFW
jgi:hypothetical protein